VRGEEGMHCGCRTSKNGFKVDTARNIYIKRVTARKKIKLFTEPSRVQNIFFRID